MNSNRGGYASTSDLQYFKPPSLSRCERLRIELIKLPFISQGFLASHAIRTKMESLTRNIFKA